MVGSATRQADQPVFGSLTQLERLYKKIQVAKRDDNFNEIKELEKETKKQEKRITAVSVDYLTMIPSYFNSGCCCFSDGDITGIEIADGCIRLIKWEMQDQKSQRIMLEEISLRDLVKQL